MTKLNIERRKAIRLAWRMALKIELTRKGRKTKGN